MATVTKDFRVKNGLVVEGTTATVNSHDILTEALVDAKGDLLVGTADNVVSRVGVGQNNYILTADSSETAGVKWAAPQAVGVFDTQITFEGATADSFETTLAVVDPTEDRTITLPNVTGTVVTTGDTGSVTNTMLAGSIANDKLLNSAITINGTSTSLGGSRTLGSDDIAEGSTNKYFTDERAQDAIGTNVGNGLDYDDNTGAISVDPSEFALSAVGAPTGNVSMATYKITGLGTPSDGTDAATKAYVDAVSEGLHVHQAARVAILTDVAIATALENGDTAGGVTLATGDRILLNGQTNGAENGIYVVQPSGQALRATDFDTATEVDSGDFIFVSAGTYANTGWVQTLKPATIGTDPISFTQFSGAGTFTAGNGLTLTGTVFSIDTTVTSDLSTAQTLTNKSISGSANTLTNIPNNALTNSAITINGTSTSLGGSRTLGSDDIAEGSTNKYFTDERAQDAVGNTVGTGLAYNDTTGAISNSGVLSIAGTLNQVTADVSTGAVTLSLPQSINTTATPTFGSVTVGSVTLADALIGTATQAITNGSATVVDTWAVAQYSSAKYLVQMKNGVDVEVIEILVTVDGNNNVYLTEYADVQSNTQLGTTDANFLAGNVQLLVTSVNGTTVKIHKTLIEA
jgi:hypothetical protein